MAAMTTDSPMVFPELDVARLDAFLHQRIPGLDGSVRLERIAGGQSNPTFFVTYANRRMVLRKKPAGAVLPSAHAVDREARILTALSDTQIPVPRVLVFYPDADVLGTPFYVMERVEGRVFGRCDLAGASPSERHAMYMSYADIMGRLHDIDWRSIGLSDFGRPSGYFARQISRWGQQWNAARFRDIPDLTRLETWLSAGLPPDDGQASICHGDFRIGNMMFHPTEPRVVAVLDWELSTIGHPMADVGFSVIAWRSTPAEYGGLLGLDLAKLGIPSEAEFLSRYYASRTTARARLTSFHVAFAMFRFAVIFEGIAARARMGTAASTDAAEVGDLSIAFARRGLQAAGLDQDDF